MWRQCTSYNVMPGEPALGKMTECELMIDREEVIEILADDMVTDGYIGPCFRGMDDYSEEDIEIETSEWLSDKDVSSLNEWMEELDENYVLSQKVAVSKLEEYI